MFKCKVCGTEIPEGTSTCPSCLVYQEPAAKYGVGDVVKLVVKDGGYVYYNYVVDSYYNRDVNMRMYRLAEKMAMPVWREDWLEPVSSDEVIRVNNTGKLRPGKRGGFELPLEVYDAL